MSASLCQCGILVVLPLSEGFPLLNFQGVLRKFLFDFTNNGKKEKKYKPISVGKTPSRDQPMLCSVVRNGVEALVDKMV